MHKRILFVVEICGLLLTSCSIQTKVPINIQTTQHMSETRTSNTPQMTQTLSQGTVPEKYQKFIGLTFPPFPGNMDEGSGGLIYPSQGTDWILNFVTIDEDKTLWLGKLVQNGNSPKWRVTDILLLPKTTSDELFVRDLCKKDGNFDPELFVISFVDSKSISTRYIDSSSIKYAWRANRSLGIFQTQEINSSIECFLDNAVELK